MKRCAVVILVISFLVVLAFFFCSDSSRRRSKTDEELILIRQEILFQEDQAALLGQCLEALAKPEKFSDWQLINSAYWVVKIDISKLEFVLKRSDCSRVSISVLLALLELDSEYDSFPQFLKDYAAKQRVIESEVTMTFFEPVYPEGNVGKSEITYDIATMWEK